MLQTPRPMGMMAHCSHLHVPVLCQQEDAVHLIKRVTLRYLTF